MKLSIRTLLLALIGFALSNQTYSLATNPDEQAEGWRTSVEHPITALFMFKGTFSGNGGLTCVVGGVTNSIIHEGDWGCGDGGDVDTDWAEVNLTLDQIYHCTFTGDYAYSIGAEVKRVPLHTILDRGGAMDRQFNLYKLYIRNKETGKWEKLCNENMPNWAIDEGIEDCQNHTLDFDIQLRRDFGARPVTRPGLKSLDGDEEPEVWTSEAGGVKSGSAPGDETSLVISSPKNADAFSMTREWAVSLGRLWSGGSAGKVRLQGNNIATDAFVKKAIVYTSPTYDTNEVQVLTTLGDTNEIAQIRAPQTLVIATNLSSMSFELRYYFLNAITGTDVNGFYLVGTNLPFVTWRIDSANNTTNNYRITEVRPWATNVTTLTYTNSSQLWSLTRGAGTDARIETRTVQITTSTNSGIITTNRLEIQEIKNGGGTVAAQNAEQYQSMPWPNFELMTLTNDPTGDKLVTSFTYGTNSAADGTYRQITSTVWPDGYWELRSYFDTDTNAYSNPYVGRLKYKVNPWKDSTLTWNTNDWMTNCVLTEYQWTDDSGDVASPAAYTMISWHWGPVNEAYGEYGCPDAWRIYIDQLFYQEVCQDTTQLWEIRQMGNNWHYGETIRTLSYTLDAGPLAGQVSARRDWNDSMDSYDYIYGNYNPTNRTFTADTNGIDTVQIVYHGSCDAFEGDFIVTGDSGYDIEGIYIKPFFSTKEVKYLDDGQLVLNRRYVYTGSETNFALIDEVVYQRDALGHTTNVFRIDPSTGQTRILRQTAWLGSTGIPGDLKQWDVDEVGTKTTYAYDTLKRANVVTKVGLAITGFPSQGDVIEITTFDASDRTLMQSKSGGGLALTTTTAYDKSGRTVMQQNDAGLTTLFGYQMGGRQISETNSAGETKITLNYLDRRVASITGSAIVNEFYDYTLTPLCIDDALYPKNVTTTVIGATNSTRWMNTATDQRYKPAQEEKPQFNNTNLIHKEFTINNPWDKGYWVEFPGVETPNWYWWLRRVYTEKTDQYGMKTVAGFGSDNGNTDLASTARLHTFSEYFSTNASGHWFHVADEYMLPTDGSASSNLFSRLQTRLTGFPSTQMSEVLSFDIHTNQTSTSVWIDRTNRLQTTLTSVAQSSLCATQATVNGLLQFDSSTTIASQRWHFYDAISREIAVRDPLGFYTGTKFSATTSQVLAVTNRNGSVTSYDYYPPGVACAGLLYAETGPTGKKTYHGYNSRGQETTIWGDIPYPEQRSYNSFGDLVTLSTYRGGTLWSGTNWPNSPGVSADTTTWYYDEPTGLLTNRTDAAGNHVAYDYYPTWDPLGRRLARGDSSTNAWSDCGDLGQTDFYGVTTYSVITTNYNRFGLPRFVSDNSGVHALQYDYAGRLIEDQCTNGVMAGTTIKTRFNPLYGKDQIIVQIVSGTTTNSFTNSFGFDAYGRVSSITNSSSVVSYSYVPSSDLIKSSTSKNGGTSVLTSTRDWDYGYRLKAVNNVSGTSGLVSRHEYLHDSLDRRRRATLSDGSSWDYSYDDRNQVTRSVHYASDFSPIAGQQFEYAYDTIGNRTISKEGGTSTGGTLRTEGYGRNSLNQITVRTNSTGNDVIGGVFAGASVSVNGVSASQKGEYFDSPLTAGGSTPLWQPVTNSATLGANSSSEAGGLVLPPLTQAFYYDLDGNLTNDCIWTYLWDAENRLVGMSMTNVTGIPNSKRYRLDFIYDKEGRRASKIVSTWDGSGFSNYQTNRYLYEGWNLMAELPASNSFIRTYTWGLDIGGSTQLSGGIGGLLMVKEDSNGGVVHFVSYDGNGNVTALVKADTTISARYEYNAFGELLRATGPFARINPIRWSTKWTDEETGLVYYGRRFYAPVSGRWINRDPIEDDGGLNLYAFVSNRPTDRSDLLGAVTLPELGVGSGGAGSLVSSAISGYNLYCRVESAIGVYNEAQKIIAMMDDGLDADELAELLQDAENELTQRLVGRAATKLAKQFKRWRQVSKLKDGEGKYREVKGHHIHQKMAFRGNVRYDEKEGFSISQKYMKERGWRHQDMTSTQRKLQDELARSGRANTIEEQTRIAYESLLAGGATQSEAKRLVAMSLADLAAQGVTRPTHIPWN